ncbi:MAG: deoxyribose-phosphate aldolase [Actinomycetaceae bacterium]|nr:deoxyribose-phosphate aldolase [Actinomycetaceae bacterium]
MNLIEKLTEIRTFEPSKIDEALQNRKPGQLPRDRNIMVIACDHPARGALGAGGDPMAMASREEVLERCVEALSRPGVDGFLGTADMIEDLALLGALEGKLVWGSMNRAGLQGASFEMDDRFNCYDAQGIVDSKLDGGKMLTRINLEDANTAATLEASANAIDELNARKVMAMVEPFISNWVDGRIVNDLSTDAVIKSIAIASGLGRSSAYTWLKLPCVDNMERVMEATTLPSLILGGEVPENPDQALEGWASALKLPNVKGLVIGRSLLFPGDGDVAKAVDNATELL